MSAETHCIYLLQGSDIFLGGISPRCCGRQSRGWMCPDANARQDTSSPNLQGSEPPPAPHSLTPLLPHGFPTAASKQPHLQPTDQIWVTSGFPSTSCPSQHGRRRSGRRARGSTPSPGVPANKCACIKPRAKAVRANGKLPSYKHLGL